MSDKLSKEILDRLGEHFPAEYIQWKPSATWSKDGKNWALAVPFVDLRYYYDRLNEVVGGDWGDEIIPIGDGNRLVIRLTVCDSTRSDVGEASGGNNAFTTAYAQGFKRVCVHYGLGAQLYTSIPQTVVPYDPQRKRITKEGFDTLRQVAIKAIQSGDHRPAEPPEIEHDQQPQAQQAPTTASGNGADAGARIGFKKAKELTGKNNPTLADVAAVGEDGLSYLRWVADNITDNPIGPAAERFLNSLPSTTDAGGNGTRSKVVTSPQTLLEYAKEQGKNYAGVALLYGALGLSGWPGANDTQAWSDLMGRVDGLTVKEGEPEQEPFRGDDEIPF